MLAQPAVQAPASQTVEGGAHWASDWHPLLPSHAPVRRLQVWPALQSRSEVQRPELFTQEPLSQVSLPEQLPQVPPQPSSPQNRPEHEGVQGSVSSGQPVATRETRARQIAKIGMRMEDHP